MSVLAPVPPLRVAIVLPCYASTPAGGLKVQYQYANGLAARGHAVTVVHPRTIDRPQGFTKRVKAALWRWKKRLTDTKLPPWFALDPRVDVRLIPYLFADAIPPGNIVVATAWETAAFVAGLPGKHGRSVQVVYDYEYWMQADPGMKLRMSSAFNIGIPAIATSPVVTDMLARHGVRPFAYIPCGVDGKAFGVDVAINERNPMTIGLPVRREPWKGTADAVSAARILRERLGSGLRVRGFGYWRPPSLPDWIDFVESPSERELRDFYNSVAVFLFPSHFEGWGLPGLEAQACGAALIAADSGGVRGYVVPGATAVLVPAGDPAALAAAAEALVREPEALQRLADAGLKRASRFSVDEAVVAFERCLLALHTS